MNIKAAGAILSTFLLTLFGILAFVLIKSSDLLEFEALELEKASKSIEYAQALKVRLLEHNRNSFLFQLHGESQRNKARELQKKEIREFLVKSSALVTSEQIVKLGHISKAINEYLKKRDQLENLQLSSIEKYTLSSENLELAFIAVDDMISSNKIRMRQLSHEAKILNRNVDRLAGILLLLCGLLLLAVSFAVYKYVVNPLTAIAKSLKLYAKGNYKTRLVLPCLYEIQQINENFNTMATELSEKQQDQMRFIASIAHDIKNPLNSILIASTLLKDHLLNKDKEFAQIIYNQVKFINRLVDDLSSSARIESGQFDLFLSNTDIKRLIEESVELFKNESLLLKFELVFHQNTNFCRCDSARLSQVINNLISNAIKYSPNGGTITIDVDLKDENYIIQIKDQGMGIDPKDIESIFKPFHRSTATKGIITGIGLGLSSSRLIVEAHGGQLLVDSTLGRGSNFIITLPANIQLIEFKNTSEEALPV